jgi:hypothetical protein
MFSQIGQDLVNDVRIFGFPQIDFHVPFLLLLLLLYSFRHGMSNRRATRVKSILKIRWPSPDTDGQSLEKFILTFMMSSSVACRCSGRFFLS